MSARRTLITVHKTVTIRTAVLLVLVTATTHWRITGILAMTLTNVQPITVVVAIPTFGNAPIMWVARPLAPTTMNAP